jgi:acyl-CoA synthetase (AMP-forming)/AMP-acid ligase II
MTTTTIIHPSPLPDVVIPDVTITAHVLRKATEMPDRVAIRDAAGTSSYTFSELSQAIHSLAGGLVARGIAPGKVVGLMAPNTPDYAVIFHGVAVAGGAVTTINPTYGSEEVRHQLQDAGASMLFVVPMFLEVARAAIEGTEVTATRSSKFPWTLSRTPSCSHTLRARPGCPRASC